MGDDKQDLAGSLRENQRKVDEYNHQDMISKEDE